jgi:hypothetical protein
VDGLWFAYSRPFGKESRQSPVRMGKREREGAPTFRVDKAAQQVEPFRFAPRRLPRQFVEEVGPSGPGCEGLFGPFKACLACAKVGRLQVDFDDCVCVDVFGRCV